MTVVSAESARASGLVEDEIVASCKIAVYRKACGLGLSTKEIEKLMESISGVQATIDTAKALQDGVKHDSGKLPYHLLPSDAVEEIVKVLQHGATKYSERNWEKGLAYSRPFAALQRHMWSWWRGDDIDVETGRSHLAHAGCCLLFLLAYELRPKIKSNYDDRPRS